MQGLTSTYLLALFSGELLWVISSVGDVFMAVGAVFISAGFKVVYLVSILLYTVGPGR